MSTADNIHAGMIRRQSPVVVLQRSYSGWKWLVFLVPLSFVAFGSAGLLYTVLHWGASVSRGRQVAANTARVAAAATDGSGAAVARRARLQRHHHQPGHPPGLSPAPSSSPAWAVFGLLTACVLWNGVVIWFVALALHGHLGGRPDWLLTLFIVPFPPWARNWRRSSCDNCCVATGIGPTLVEISGHPLLPGGNIDVFVSQSGRFKLARLDLRLVCEEEATYRQGTNTRSETREVFRQQVLRCESAASQAAPFAAVAAMRCPPGRCTRSGGAQRHPVEIGGPRRNWRLARVSPLLRRGRLSAIAAGEERPVSDRKIVAARREKRIAN